MMKAKKTPKFWAAILVLVVNLIMAVSSMAWLDYSRARYHQAAADNARNMAQTVEISLTSLLRSVDLSLQGISREISLCKAERKCLPGEGTLLENYGSGLVEVQAYFLTDATGLVVERYSRKPDFTRVRLDFSDRNHFREIQARPERGLAFSEPHLSRATGQWAISLARPVVSREGKFMGAVMADLDLASLQRQFEKIRLGARGAMSIRDDQMGVILRFPEPRGIGANIGARNISAQLAALLKEGVTQGVYRATTPLDSVERTVAFVRSENYPVFVNVGLSSADYLLPWNTELWAVAALQVLILGLSILMARHLYKQYTDQEIEISLRRATEAELLEMVQEHRAILQSEVVGFVMSQGDEITWMNPVFCLMLGYGDGVLAGGSMHQLFPSDQAHESFRGAADKAIQSGEIYRTQVQLVRKDGSLGWFDVSGAQLRPDSRDCIWAVVDMTEQKLTEAKLIHAQEVAEDASKAKSRFLATMSHEIRTPMNGILGMAQLLYQMDVSDAERRDCARTILNSGQILLSLLNDVLDFSKIEAGKVELEESRFMPEQLLGEILALFERAAENKGLSISAAWSGAAAGYLGDAVRLRQMLSNLTNNALKFTRSGSITLQGQEVSRKDDRAVVRFSVTDTGIGVAADKLAALFQPFSQGDTSTTREFGGTGLGLSIVRNLAELMHGRVGVESTQGQGATFWFEVELAVVPGGSTIHHEPGSLPGEQLSAGSGEGLVCAVPGDSMVAGHVLVVEDNPTNRKVMDAMLRRLGVKVTLVEDGLQGFQALTAGHEDYDLVLMDIQMPVMDGYEAVRRIRQWEFSTSRQPVPIVAVTADAFEEDRDRCLSAGMNDFLTKPINIDQVQEALARWLPKTSTAR